MHVCEGHNERLCSLDVLGVEDRGQDGQVRVYSSTSTPPVGCHYSSSYVHTLLADIQKAFFQIG